MVRRARVAQWLVEAANGSTHAEIAARHEVSVVTVRSAFKWAEAQGFFEKADEAIRNRLVPLALDVVEKQMKRELLEGGAETAMKVLFGVRVLSTNGPTRGELLAADDQIEDAEMTWERLVLRRRMAQKNETHPSADSEGAAHDGADGASEESPAIDAEIVCTECGEAGDLAEREESGRGGESDAAGQAPRGLDGVSE